jgi:hypothetical protein
LSTRLVRVPAAEAGTRTGDVRVAHQLSRSMTTGGGA